MTGNGQRILVVEDEPQLSAVLAEYLSHDDYSPEVMDTGVGVVEAVREKTPALILLDLMLPGKDGLTICREIRAFSNVPIIMVTARVEEIDRLLGLELGADDYICKPFSPREVVARVRAVLRRGTAPSGPVDTPTAGLMIDEDRFEAHLDGQLLDLTPVEFRLLTALSSRAGRVWSRTQLMDELYDDHRVVSDRTVDSHVKNVRKKLQSVNPAREFIRSIYGVGYKLDWDS